MKVKQYVNRQINRLFISATYLKSRSKEILKSNIGTGYLEDGTKAIVIFAICAIVFLAVRSLFGDDIIPALKQQTKDLFNYK